jgi:hypothetical protein
LDGIKNYNLPIPRPRERTSKLQKNPSALKREHPALQNMKFLNFFLLLWEIFALLDPYPDSESGYGSTDLIESVSGSETLIESMIIDNPWTAWWGFRSLGAGKSPLFPGPSSRNLFPLHLVSLADAFAFLVRHVH